MRRIHAVLSLLPLVACQDDPPEIVRKTIGAEGGLISSHDQRLSIVLQPGALQSDTEIIIFPSEAPPEIFGAAYRVQPDIELRVDAEVTYRRPLPPTDPRAVAVGAVKLDDFAQGRGFWQPLPRLVLDLTNESVTGSDDQLSLYYGMFDFNSLVDDGVDTESVPTGCDVDISECYTGFDYVAGPAPRDVCFGDFNGDGNADVATANSGADTISILFGDGVGALGSATSITVGDGPSAIACAQMDPGPQWDFVVALGGAGSVVSGLNEGDGTSFILGAPVPVAAGPVDLQLIDLDGDGDLDVPVASSSGTVTALNFTPPDLIALGTQGTGAFVAAPGGLAVGNFNVGADQNPDVFVFGGDTAVSALGAGNGSFGPFNGNVLRIGSAFAKGVSADVNGDGTADVVIADAGMGGVHILESAGNGVEFVTSFYPTGAGASDAVVGDFNGDGARFDIAVANATAGTVTVLVRFGMEFVDAGDLPTGGGPSGIAAADVNLDGTQDIVVSNEADGSVTLLFSRSSG